MAQRKVINRYRALWAAESEADIPAIGNTVRLDGSKILQTILTTAGA